MKIRALLLPFLGLSLLAAACGGGDNCTWQWRCDSIGGDLTCRFVKVCSRDPGYESARRLWVQALSTVPGDAWDVRLAGTATVGAGSVLEGLLGGALVRHVGAEEASTWWLHAWPAQEVRAALGEQPPRGLESVRTSPGRDDPDPATCSPWSWVDADVLAPFPERVGEDEALSFEAPRGVELVPFGPVLALALTLRPPDGGEARTLFPAEGESVPLAFDVAGRWHVRVVLVTRDLCEPGTLDAVLLQDADVDVVAAP